MYKHLIRPILFSFHPETAHRLTFKAIKILQNIPFVGPVSRRIFQVKGLERDIFGLHFKNPVGLAAGLDKDATLFNELGNYGFGFIEVGTLTPKAQPGNPAPRLFRLKKDQGLINRMGFNNKGIDMARRRLSKRRTDALIGGNIGKNKITPNAEAVNDYLMDFRALYPYVDYFAVNVSSPNTPGLRQLQEKEPLMELLSALEKENSGKPARKPILLKIAPDLTDHQLDDIIEIVKKTGIDGVIATNTTLSREGLSIDKETIEQIGAGGLSGLPLKDRSTEVIRYLHEKSKGAFPIVGVGGIHGPEDALEKLRAGASLVQVYTGFIYEGPYLVKRINQAIKKAGL